MNGSRNTQIDATEVIEVAPLGVYPGHEEHEKQDGQGQCRSDDRHPLWAPFTGRIPHAPVDGNHLRHGRIGYQQVDSEVDKDRHQKHNPEDTLETLRF